MSKRHAQRGFSLIELMIAVAIVGILAAVAYPSYMHAQVKNRRAVAQAALMNVAQRQQQYLMDNRAYAASVAALGITPTAEVTAFYTTTGAIETSTAPMGYTVTWAPIAGTSQANDGSLVITSEGKKLPEGKW